MCESNQANRVKMGPIYAPTYTHFTPPSHHMCFAWLWQTLGRPMSLEAVGGIVHEIVLEESS